MIFLLTSLPVIIQNLLVGVIMKTQTTIRVEETSYQQAKEILSQLGLNYSQAISVLNPL